MNFLYDPLEADDVSRVRGIIGDTDIATGQLDDETITTILTTKGSVALAAIECVRRLILKYARQPDVRFGPSSVSGSQIAKQYREALRDLQRAAASSAAPYVGGISKADKDSVSSNTDRVEPAFTKTMFEYQGDAAAPLSEFDD